MVREINALFSVKNGLSSSKDDEIAEAFSNSEGQAAMLTISNESIATENRIFTLGVFRFI
ncbi:MAG: hypothetical protein ACR2IS_18090 [Nitrososphaeraceae archaeon]